MLVGTSTPPTKVQGANIGGAKAREYDKSQKAGADAIAVLENWKSAMTDDMPAPWRQTAGAGGSEYGKPKWLAVLKAGFKNAAEPPEFKLWQLALADHVVRLSYPRLHWRKSQAGASLHRKRACTACMLIPPPRPAWLHSAYCRRRS